MNIHEILQAMYDNAKPNEDGKTFTNGHVMHNLLFRGKPIVSVGADELENFLHNPKLFTLAPRTHTVNSFVVPAPMDVEPDKNSPFFAIALSSKNLTPCYKWYGDSEDITLFRRGVCFHTQEAAQQNALAMLGRDPAKGVDGV